MSEAEHLSPDYATKVRHSAKCGQETASYAIMSISRRYSFHLYSFEPSVHPKYSTYGCTSWSDRCCHSEEHTHTRPVLQEAVTSVLKLAGSSSMYLIEIFIRAVRPFYRLSCLWRNRVRIGNFKMLVDMITSFLHSLLDWRQENNKPLCISV